jgi:membrane-associated phospholipid phosphatase
MATNTISTTVQKLQPRKDVLPGLRAPGLLARWPIIGLIMFIFGGLVFGALTYNLFAHGPLLQWDRALAISLPAIGLKSPPFVKYAMITAFYVGERVIIVIDILLSLYFLYKRYWRELAMVTIGGIGASLLFHSLSTFIARQRPPTQIWTIVHIPGYPSGHAISVIACYGLLAYLLVPKMPSAFWKVVVVSAALFIIGFVGFSRVFTGGHYLTDVLSGYAVGIAWFGMVYTLIEIYF